MRIPLSNVPIAARRIAAQHLASIHGTAMAPVKDAALADFAVPIFRPDIDGVAYYEIPVVSTGGGRRILLSKDYLLASRDSIVASGHQSEAAGDPVGFIMVTNGRHDFPISHWSLDRLPPSQQVLQPAALCDCEAPRERAEPAKLYRLDALAYAAEDKNGELVGRTGQMPGLLTGLPHSLSKFAGVINSSIARATDRSRTDESAGDASHEMERSGPPAPELKADDRGGWAAFKARYADAFGPLLDHLRERAGKTWELHDLIEKLGEGVEAGSTIRVALLGPASIELAGPGRKFVRAGIDESGEGQIALVLATERVQLKAEIDLEVRISYANGERESRKFFLYTREVPSNEKSRRDGTDPCDCEE